MIKTVSEYDITKVKLMPNNVVVRVETQFEDTTSGGVAISTLHNPTLHSSIHGEIVNVCDRLLYNENSENSMGWDCDIDCMVGDEVFMHFDAYFKAKQDNKIIVQNEQIYWIIDYWDIRLVRRNGRTIMCNGYVLLEPVMQKDLPESVRHNGVLIDVTGENFSKKFVRVYKIGKPNREYLERDMYGNKYKADPTNLKEGDLIALWHKAVPILLETNLNRKYEDRQLYCLQGCYLVGEFNNENK